MMLLTRFRLNSTYWLDTGSYLKYSRWLLLDIKTEQSSDSESPIAPMPPAKFPFNSTYGLGGGAV